MKNSSIRINVATTTTSRTTTFYLIENKPVSTAALIDILLDGHQVGVPAEVSVHSKTNQVIATSGNIWMKNIKVDES